MPPALEANPLVEKVYHPSLESHPHRELALALFRPEACGAMLSFSLPEDPERIDRFMAALKMVGFANTLGGFRTTVAHPATQSHSSLTPEERAALGIHYGTIRVSVGIEYPRISSVIFRRPFRKALSSLFSLPYNVQEKAS